MASSSPPSTQSWTCLRTCGTYSSTAKATDGSKFYVNIFNSLGSIFQTNGKIIKLIPRTVQVYPRAWLKFKKPKNELMDTFTIFLNHLEEVILGTRCGEVQKGVVIKNGSTVAIPLQRSCRMLASRRACSEAPIWLILQRGRIWSDPDILGFPK